MVHVCYNVRTIMCLLPLLIVRHTVHTIICLLTVSIVRNTVRTIICLTVSYGTLSVRYAQSVVPLPEVEAGITATLGVPDRTPAVGVPHVGSVTLRPKKKSAHQLQRSTHLRCFQI